MIKSFEVDAWDCSVTLTTSQEDYLEHTGLESIEYPHLTAFKDREAVILVDMSKFESLNSSAALRTISHECNHAAMTILDVCGCEFSGEHQEALAYTQDYIFAMCYELILEDGKQ